MRSVHEHGQRDGSPETFNFFGNFPPCVQCVELLNLTDVSTYPVDGPCDDPTCSTAVDSIFASANPAPQPGYPKATQSRNGNLYFNIQSGAIWTERPIQTTGVDSLDGVYFAYRLLLHGVDNELEPALLPEDRILAWNYELVYENDPDNAVRDGGGNDGLDKVTRQFEFNNPNADIYVDNNGVWIMRIEFFVPTALLYSSAETLWNSLYGTYQDTDVTDAVFALVTKQLGDTDFTVKARDASDCIWRDDRGKYFYYTGVRPPVIPGQGTPGHVHAHRNCQYDDASVGGFLELDYYSFESDEFLKQYKVKVLTLTGEVYPED